MLDPARMPDALLKEYLKPYYDDPGARAALSKFAREFNPRAALENEIRPKLQQLQLPVLLVWGGQNAYVPLTVGRKLDDDIPNSNIVTILRTNHYIQEERPEEVRAVMKEFIQKQGPT